jgi:hypothetical protein
MKRPLSDYRLLGPFASIEKEEFDLLGPGSELGKVHNARTEIIEAYKNTPEWAKDVDECVDWMLSNIRNELVEVLEAAQSTGKEHTFSVCYDGSEAIVSQTESGAIDTAPSVSCGKDTWKVIEVHTHPKDAPLYPSFTDLRRLIHTDKVPIPSTLNEVIVAEDALVSCLNLYDIDARVETIELIKQAERSAGGNDINTKPLVDEYGAEFNLRSH